MSGRFVHVALLALAIWSAPSLAQSSRAPDAARLYATGAYEALLRRDPTSPDEAWYAVRALTHVGQPVEAIRRAATFRTAPVTAGAIATAYETLGQLDSAAAAWRIAQTGRDSLRARVELLRMQRERGAVDSAMRGLAQLTRAVEARGAVQRSRDLHAMATAYRLLGRGDPANFKQALRYFDRAIAADSLNVDARAELGELFVEKFNYADARSTLTSLMALNARIPRALLALVRLNAAEGAPVDALRRVLMVDSTNAEGNAMAARRLTEAEQYDAAVLVAQHGLERDSTAPAPWIEIAAARWLAHDTTAHRAALARAHARSQGSAKAEVELAEVAARNRLYGDAVTFARQGVARDSLDARALALLGVNLLRTGEPGAARAALTRAFEVDPFDVWSKNTLDLLDAYANARTVASEHFDFVIEPKDAELLALYAAPLAEAAWRTLTSRYGYTPSGRVRVEFFRSHADFSVRAVGLAGLGALGVAFGNVLAIDAPPARPRGEFNWSAVLWHEFGHTITLGSTENRVPRWVSEGLSVLEERRATRAWGGGITPNLLAAYSAGLLQPVSRLNDGFVHPRFGEEVTLSYALAAYVFEMLEERQGIAGLRALLAGYRRGGRTPELMQQVYGFAPAALDSTFDAWFRLKFRRELMAVRGMRATADDGQSPGYRITGPFREAMTAAITAAQRQSWPEVSRAAQAAVSMLPDFAERGSGYHLLADAALARRDTAGAIDALTAITVRNGDAVDENLSLARLLEARRDTVGAMAALERATQIDPFDAAAQARLADLATAARRWDVAVRARRAVLALGPADRAEAFYRLAQALVGAGDLPSARREVLRALDLAPTFEAAQDLLLTIRSTPRAP